jgi:CBS domain-containing protein
MSVQFQNLTRDFMDLNQPISNVMTAHPVCLHPSNAIKYADTLFQSHRFRHLPVVDQGKLVGIITKSDLYSFQRGFETGSNNRVTVQLKTGQVKDIMTPQPVTLAPNAPVRDAMLEFSKNDFHAIPIVDGDQVVGIFTTIDLIRLFAHKSSAPGLESIQQ